MRRREGVGEEGREGWGRREGGREVGREGWRKGGSEGLYCKLKEEWAEGGREGGMVFQREGGI